MKNGDGRQFLPVVFMYDCSDEQNSKEEKYIWCLQDSKRDFQYFSCYHKAELQVQVVMKTLM
jgi:hypothetical protein